MQEQAIAIVGAGFSGTLLAIHLLRQSPDRHVHLIERSSAAATGLAYATDHPGHLLNVPAGRMGAFADRPGDFLAWLERQGGGDAAAFMPRHTYGAYLQSLLTEARNSPAGQRLHMVQDTAVALDDDHDGATLTLASGGTLRAGAVVLATGNFGPPPVCPGSVDCSLWRASPWQAGALTGIDPSASVLLVGTGLTMIDAVIQLIDTGHTGPIHAVSRRGLLPRVHTATPVTPPAGLPPYPTGLRALTRHLRQQAEQALAAGQPWQAVIDALRPVTQDLWQALSLDDRRRFLRHARCWWDIFRHRMAPQIAARIDAAQRSGQFRVTAGRVVHCESDGDRLDVLIRPRAADHPVSLRVARAINCTGLVSDIAKVEEPLLRSLFQRGAIRPDALGLGLDVTTDCAVHDASGAVSRRLFALGPMTKGVFWEIIAVPDIRRQCESLARHLLAPVRQPV